MNDLPTLADHAEETARKIISRGKQLTPMLLYDKGEDLVVMAVPEYGDHSRKRVLQMLMTSALERDVASRYIFVMEAWFTEHDKPVSSDYLPSENAGRREAIVISGASCSGETLLRIIEIVRHGSKVEFKPTRGMDAHCGPPLELFARPTVQ